MGTTYLHVRRAAVNGDLEELKEVLKDSVRLDVDNAKGPQGETVLHNAAIAGHLNIAEYLINMCKCDVNQQDDDGQTPLHLASQIGHLNMVKYLVKEHGANPMQEDYINGVCEGL